MTTLEREMNWFYKAVITSAKTESIHHLTFSANLNCNSSLILFTCSLKDRPFHGSISQTQLALLLWPVPPWGTLLRQRDKTSTSAGHPHGMDVSRKHFWHSYQFMRQTPSWTTGTVESCSFAGANDLKWSGFVTLTLNHWTKNSTLWRTFIHIASSFRIQNCFFLLFLASHTRLWTLF